MFAFPPIRKFALAALSAATLLGAAGAALTPAQADPAYRSQKVVAWFEQAKEARKLGAARTVCFDSDPGCDASASNARFDLLVNFEFNSDQLTDSARENLGQFAKALADPELKGQRFEIDGHTDATGAETYNLSLSDRRARAVVAYLASQGVDAATLLPKGFGKTRPRVADPFSAENRRVETHMMD